jgi:hypothetical protein
MKVSLACDSSYGLAVERGMSENEFKDVWSEQASKPTSRNYVGERVSKL